MEKRFRGAVRSSVAVNSDHPCGKMATGNVDDSIHWPSVAGPSVPDNNPKLWKTPKLDMSSSLAFLRRELAAMQLQDRGIHKQLLALNNSISDLKTNLDESWKAEDNDSIIQTIEDESDREVLGTTVLLSTQVSHAKQDSGILTDEESGNEDCEVFENRETFRPMRKSRSVSAICMPSGVMQELDINQNVKTVTKPTARPRSHTISEGQFHSVTSMPVINEIPGDNRKNSSFSGKAFAISGFLNKARADMRPQSQLGFSAMSRYESMPSISNIGRTSVRHVQSETVPFIQDGNDSSLNSDRFLPSKNKRKPLYRIWRSSSQISLV